MASKTYVASSFSKQEEKLMQDFFIQRDDAKLYFKNVIKPRLDRSYKLYISDNTDRSKEIKSWQANVFVPYINAVVETLKPRILDARPEFTVQGRNQDDQLKAERIKSLNDYTWEISGADNTAELVTSSALIYGTGYMQASWKKDVRNLKFLTTKDIDKKTYQWKEQEKTFYDAPFVEWVDNYSLWYDWHNVNTESKQYWFKRLLLTENEIRRRYPMLEEKRLLMALDAGADDTTDYASIRNEVKLTHDKINKGADHGKSNKGITTNIYNTSDVKMNEVFEWLRPFEDTYAVMVNDVPILKGGSTPNPYDFKESFFIPIPYLKVPGEFEGYGLPMLLENPQIMLNMTKNQRLDAMTLSIHKMWIVNPLANINKQELVSRPMGIVYSSDPNGAREIQMSDIKPSAYKEEELLKGDMRYASGVDDFSMGGGSGGSSSATEVRHLRESTLERVRLFVNHMGDGYAKLMRFWISMYKQFYTDQMIIRITGDNGELQFPLIEKDDLLGEYDYKATVKPSIAGQNDVKKKQDMDLYQLLRPEPSVDPDKLIAKLLYDFDMDYENIKKMEEVSPQPTPEEMMAMQQGQEQPPIPEKLGGGSISEDVAAQALALFGPAPEGAPGNTPFSELSSPVNLLNTMGQVPPTPTGVGQTTNPRGFNLGGKVNTNISQKPGNGPEAQLLNRVNNIQK